MGKSLLRFSTCIPVLLLVASCTSGISTKGNSKKKQKEEVDLRISNSDVCKNYGMCKVTPSSVKYLTRDELQNSIQDLLALNDAEAATLTAGWTASPRENGLDVVLKESILLANVELRLQASEKAGAFAVESPRLTTCVLSKKVLSTACQKALTALAAEAFRIAIPAELLLLQEEVKATSKKMVALISEWKDAPDLNPDIEGIRGVAQWIFANPRFYLKGLIGVPSTGIRRLSSVEVAARLSFALNVSTPDTALLKEASSGKLTSPESVREYAKKMLGVKKTRDRFIYNLFAKWFSVDKMNRSGTESIRGIPLAEYYAEFEGLFDILLTENLPLRKMMQPGFAVLTPALAKHYGISAAEGAGRTTTTARGGLLQMAAFHISNSSNPEGETNSTIQKGLLVLNRVMCASFEPLSNSLRAANDSISAQLENEGGPSQNIIEHWERISNTSSGNACMSCHRTINPIGFALEFYAPDGRARTTFPNGSDINFKLDFYGKNVQSSQDLIEAIYQNERFRQCFSARAYSYFIGETSSIAAQVSVNPEVGLRDLVLDFVSSEAFLTDAGQSAPSEK